MDLRATTSSIHGQQLCRIHNAKLMTDAHDQNMSPPGRIAIVGAGPAGLTLSRCLKAKGISSIVYDKNPEIRKYGYSIILQPAQFQPVLQLLGIAPSSLSSQTAVQPRQIPHDATAFRARRTAFEDVLRDGARIQYGHEVKAITPLASGIEIEFSQGDKTTADLLIAADGTHSSVRSAMLPQFQLDILPYVAFNGKRRLAELGPLKHAFEQDLTLSYRVGSTLLQAYVNDLAETGGASVSYTFSRPAQGSDDPCHKPNRPKASAKDIPEEFFAEVQQLQDQGLPQPWKSIFDVEAMKNDRLLHWLMRSGLPTQDELRTKAQQNCAFLGDALLTSPIIGSRGANAAMQQALDLASAIEKGTVPQWVSHNYNDLKTTAQDDIDRLEDLHRSDSKI